MKRFARTRRVIGTPFKAMSNIIKRMAYPVAYSLVRWVSSRLDYQGIVGYGDGSSVVMAPIQWLMRNSAQAKVELLKDGDETPVEKHDMLNLLKRPNPYFTWKRMLQAILLSLMQPGEKGGNAYLIKVRDDRKKVVELWWAPSHLVDPYIEPGSDDYVTYYKYHVGSGVKVYPEHMIHIKIGFNPNNIVLGQSPLFPALREIWGDIEAANYTGTMMKNMGIPGVIISPDGDEAHIEDANEVSEVFQTKFGGDRRGQAMVMKGKTKVEQFGFDPKKMAVPDVRDISEERVCGCIGMPPAVVQFGTGLQQTKVGATMKELREEAWENCMIPYLDDIIEQIGDDIIPEYEQNAESYILGMNYSGVRALSESEDAKHKRANMNLRSGMWTVSRAQQYVGDDPDPSRNVYLIPSNVIEVGANEPAKMLKRGKKERPPRGSARLMAQFTSEQHRLETVLEGKVFGILDELGAAMESVAETLLGLKQEELDGNELLGGIRMDEYEADLSEAIGLHYGTVAKSTANSFNATLGIAIDVPDPVAREIVAEGGRRAGLLDLSGSSRAKLFRILAQAQEEGIGAPEIARRIRDVPAGRYTTSRIRANQIARTETLHAQRTSALHLARAHDPTVRVMVFDGRLGNTDEECMSRNGMVVSQDEAWTMAAEEHPNGTLSFVPYFE